MNRVAFHVTNRRVLRGEMEDFYREEGGARKLLATTKKVFFWAKTSSLGGGREGKSKHFTKQIASFSSVRRTDNFIGADQKIPNCWLRLHFWGRWKL